MRPELGQEENHEEQENQEEEEQEEAPFKELFVISFCYRGLKKTSKFCPQNMDFSWGHKIAAHGYLNGTGRMRTWGQ